MNKLIFKYEKTNYIAIIHKKGNNIYIIFNKHLEKNKQKRIKRILNPLTCVKADLGFLFILKGRDNKQGEKLETNKKERFE